jgi:membrane protease YdiL (CAAX protease family)
LAVLLLGAMALGPTVAAWVYFVALEGDPAARWVYLSSKVVQFGLPLLLLLCCRPSAPGPRLSHRAGARLGMAVGLGLAAPILLVPRLLEATGLRATAVAGIGEKLGDFGVLGVWRFLLFALVLSLLHSALEEYYWRWSLFATLRTWMGDAWASVLASAAFASHHVVVVAQFVGSDGGMSAAMTVLAGVAVFAAGVAWCLTYVRSGRLTASWFSHVVVDLALFGIGAALAGDALLGTTVAR